MQLFTGDNIGHGAGTHHGETQNKNTDEDMQVKQDFGEQKRANENDMKLAYNRPADDHAEEEEIAVAEEDKSDVGSASGKGSGDEDDLDVEGDRLVEDNEAVVPVNAIETVGQMHSKPQCHICKKIYHTKHNLAKHLGRFKDHEKKHLSLLPPSVSLTCEYCNNVLKSRKGYNRHVKICKTRIKKELLCEACGDVFFSTKRKCIQQCDKCQRSCRKCGKLFANQSTAGKHMKKKICESTTSTFPCPHCDKLFRTADYVQTHVKIVHLRIMKYTCEFCAKQFAKHSNFASHIRFHIGTKYDCSVCSKQYSSVQALAEHMILHTGAGEHKCGYCGKTFAQKHMLVTHERVHTGEKPFQCRYCEKYFAKSSNRKVHERLIHTKEFPHSCPHCVKGFVARNAMNKHAEDCSLNRSRETML